MTETVVGGYCGEYLSLEEKTEYGVDCRNAKHLFILNMRKDEDPLYLDGASFCPTSKINDVYKSDKVVNCRYIQARNRDYANPNFLSVITTKEVKKGEELFSSYGEDYWSNFICFYFNRK